MSSPAEPPFFATATSSSTSATVTLDKPLHELTEDDISQLTHEDCRRYLKLKVLSDADKRFMYDVGIHDSDDDENGMADFLREMTTMMKQNDPKETVETSFEELKDLFEEMFQSDIESSKSFTSNKRCSSEMSTSMADKKRRVCSRKARY